MRFAGRRRITFGNGPTSIALLFFFLSLFPLSRSLARSHQPNDSAPVVAFPERRAPRGRLTTRSRARLGWTNADVTVPSRTVYANNSARDPFLCVERTKYGREMFNMPQEERERKETWTKNEIL